MPSLINLGMLNVNTPQQNSSVFLGESIVTGMDANMKFNAGRSGQYGFYCVDMYNFNLNVDSMEFADGNIFDQDLKPNLVGGNI